MIAARATRPRLYLKLGRVSNLPTVWTNVTAGIALGGGSFGRLSAIRLAVALSLFYVGGMFLNDAFDRDIDARERPERPIPSGQIDAKEVFTVGLVLLVVGLGATVIVASTMGASPVEAALSGAVLGGLILLYDAWHKQNPLSPVVMGLCRSGVYVTAGLAANGVLSHGLVSGALAGGAYVVGLTFVARQENRKSFRAGATLLLLASPALLAVVHPSGGMAVWLALGAAVAWAVAAVVPLFRQGPVNVPRSVVRLIAGVSLVDGLLLALAGEPGLALLGAVGLGATLGLQRWVRGT
ncbi:MAG TPA: UbiA family prenyltransferase [Polyangiaceae bacterium]|jgi:4-hydroxybenzoate polyprenyltransferase|nr:UbiA family prenyltransferase [Polyangiaceae bacterium]